MKEGRIKCHNKRSNQKQGVLLLIILSLHCVTKVKPPATLHLEVHVHFLP